MPAPSIDIDAALPRFGLRQFRPGQREVISTVLAGHDCLCVMPTGGGKSLCYQLPAVVRGGLTIVVSPLIALMKDQVDSLKLRGIAATVINSSLTPAEQTERLESLTRGEYQLVYIAPERLRNGRFLDAIRATPINLLAIDEAHCISEWGHDFRPDYARIGRLREALGMVQTIALTATATEKVRQDIAGSLRLKEPRQFITGFARKNLHFGALVCNSERDKNRELIDFLRQQKGSGIVYAATRKRCEAVVEMIRQEVPDLSIDVYHAGLMPDQRKEIQDRFMAGKLRSIVATNAFGMGIDKSDLRFVIHYNLPGTLEAYYQEAGRAGRDGLPSVCVLLYSTQDRYIQEFFIENANPPAALVRTVYEFLRDQPIDPIELTSDEIRERIGTQAGSEAINTCLQILGKTNVLERLDVGGGLAMVRIDSTLPTLVDLLPKEAKIRRKVLRAVERVVGDNRDEAVYVHPRYLMQTTGFDRDQMVRALTELRKIEGFDYVPPFRGRAIHFRQSGVSFEKLGIDFEALEARKKADYEKLDRVVAFARSIKCRQLTILEYFGDNTGSPCGGCDRCQGQGGWPAIADADGTPAITPAQSGEDAFEPSTQQRELVQKTLSAVERLYGRVGKLLIAEYLVGSETVKVQRLRLHRLSDFGLLKEFRKKDAVAILDAMLSCGLLEQQELNANRPTVAIADGGKRIATEAAAPIPTPVCDAFGFIPKTRKKSAAKQPAAASPPAAASQPAAAPSPAPSPAATLPAATESARQRPPAESSAAADRLPSGEEPGSGPRAAAADHKPAADRLKLDPADWKWTAKLAEQHFSLHEIMSIRRMAVDEVIDDLQAAVDAGTNIDIDRLLDRRQQLALRDHQDAAGRPEPPAVRERGDYRGSPSQSEEPIARLARLAASQVGRQSD